MSNDTPDAMLSLPPVGLLALCPLLAAADTLLSASCMALLFLVTLVPVHGTLALMGGSIATGLRVIALFLVCGFWVSLVDIGLQAWNAPMRDSLGLYVPLLAANVLVLAGGELALRGGGVATALGSGVRLGVAAAVWIVPLGLVRETLGRGAVLTDAALAPGVPGPFTVGSFSMPLLQGPPGAFLLLALAAALAAWAGCPGNRA